MHAELHFKQEGHALAVQVGGGCRVWDYSQDNFIHRMAVVQSGAVDGGLKGAAGLSRSAAGMWWASSEDMDDEEEVILASKMEWLDEYYTRLLETQLSEQLHFYERLLHDKQLRSLDAVETAGRRALTQVACAALAELCHNYIRGSMALMHGTRMELDDQEKANQFLETTLRAIADGNSRLGERLRGLPADDDDDGDVRNLKRRSEALQDELDAVLSSLCS